MHHFPNTFCSDVNFQARQRTLNWVISAFRRRILGLMMLLSAICLFPIDSTLAETAVPMAAQQPASQLDDDIEALKKQVLDVNRELFMIEEDILYPESTQFTVFLSIDIGDFFALDSVQLRIDDKVATNYLYTQRELIALKKGGVQRLYQGNLKSGDHEITAFLIGKGPQGRDYKRGVTRTINKTLSPLSVELKIIDDTTKEQPVFEFAVWDH